MVPLPPRGVEKRRDRSQLYDEGPRCMLPPFSYDTTSSQCRQQRDDRRAHGGDSAGTLVAASGYQQNFARPADLSLAQPCFGTMARIRGGRQRLPKIQNVLRPELGLVESLPDGIKGDPTGSHSEVYDRPVFPAVLHARSPPE